MNSCARVHRLHRQQPVVGGRDGKPQSCCRARIAAQHHPAAASNGMPAICKRKSYWSDQNHGTSGGGRRHDSADRGGGLLGLLQRVRHALQPPVAVVKRQRPARAVADREHRSDRRCAPPDRRRCRRRIPAPLARASSSFGHRADAGISTASHGHHAPVRQTYRADPSIRAGPSKASMRQPSSKTYAVPADGRTWKKSPIVPCTRRAPAPGARAPAPITSRPQRAGGRRGLQPDIAAADHHKMPFWQMPFWQMPFWPMPLLAHALLAPAPPSAGPHRRRCAIPARRPARLPAAVMRRARDAGRQDQMVVVTGCLAILQPHLSSHARSIEATALVDRRSATSPARHRTPTAAAARAVAISLALQPRLRQRWALIRRQRLLADQRDARRRQPNCRSIATADRTAGMARADDNDMRIALRPSRCPPLAVAKAYRKPRHGQAGPARFAVKVFRPASPQVASRPDPP